MNKRVNVVLSDKAGRRLEKLKHLTNASSDTEVIRNALYVKELLHNYAAAGITLTTSQGETP